MAYSEKLAERIRKRLVDVPNVEEKAMMGGLAFMLNGKMCVGVSDAALMCRINPELYESALHKKGCRPMDFTGRPMRGWVFIDEDGMQNSKDFDYWINLALEFNKLAKPYKKKSRVSAKRAAKKSKQ